LRKIRSTKSKFREKEKAMDNEELQKILASGHWNLLDDKTREMLSLSQKRGSGSGYVEMLRAVAKNYPEYIDSKEIFEQALTILSREIGSGDDGKGFNFFDALKEIGENAELKGVDAMEKIYTQESLSLDILARERAKSESMSYTDALREVSTEHPELVAKVEKYVADNEDINKKVLVYIEQHPESKMTYTETLIHLKNLEDAGIEFNPKK